MPPRRVIGLDAGGTKLLAGVVDERLRVSHRSHRLWVGRDRDEVLETMAGMVEQVCADVPDAEGVGFGIPSLVDFETGESMSSVHLPLDGVPFRDLMRERLGLPVHVDNDANLAALAEQRHGAARGAADVVMLTLGTGIGGGLVLGGELYRGRGGSAGELGHMVVDFDGAPCSPGCPNRGCLETVASGTAIGQEGAEAARRLPDSALGRAAAAGPITGLLVTSLALDGDSAAADVLATVGRRLGAGLSSIVNAFDPEIVVIGGGAVASGELLLAPAREEMLTRVLPTSRPEVRLVAAEFGQEAGMIGAGILALESSGSP